MITPDLSDVDGTFISRRLSRVWRVSHTGNIGTVDLSVDLSTVPGPKTEADLRLLIDRDGDGFFDNDVVPLTGTLTGNTFSLAGIAFQDGDYFTIGAVNGGSTPLPVELTEFTSICHEKTIELIWTTASEKESATFVVEKSNDGKTWMALKQIPGAGNSTSQKTYSCSDTFSKSELTYYRLTQVDFNGNTQTFPLLSVNCINKNDNMLVYPNPSIHELFVELNLSKAYGDAEIIIMNALGKVCLREAVLLKKGTVEIKIPLSIDSGPYTLILQSPKLNFPPQKLIVK
jgi:hypothetical protein